MSKPLTITIALSGPSSSGKSSIAPLLAQSLALSLRSESRTVKCSLLCQDDFYKTDAAIPQHPTLPWANWDSHDAIDWTRFKASLHDTRVATTDVHIHIILVEGFLLFSPVIPAAASISFDVKMLLLISRDEARARRQRREEYVTAEGFWKDPDGYFDQVVWPQWENAHAGFLTRGETGEHADGSGLHCDKEERAVADINEVAVVLLDDCWSVDEVERVVGQAMLEQIRSLLAHKKD